jgi:hypothetical protein
LYTEVGKAVKRVQAQMRKEAIMSSITPRYSIWRLNMMTIHRRLIYILLLSYLTLTACKINHPILAREPIIDKDKTDNLTVQTSLVTHTTRSCWQGISTHGQRTFILAMSANVGQLLFSDQDARQFAQAIQKRFKVPNQQVCLLQGVYRAEFQQALNNLKLKVNSNDRVIIFFSGAGSYIRDDNGDERDQMDEILVTLDVQQTKHPNRQHVITDDHFAKFINRLPTQNIITFIDASYSAHQTPQTQDLSNQTRPKFFAKGEIGTFPRTQPETQSHLEQIKGQVFSAAQASQPPYEMKQGGLFTQTFLKLLTHYPNATLSQIFQYTQAEIQ